MHLLAVKCGAKRFVQLHGHDPAHATDRNSLSGSVQGKDVLPILDETFLTQRERPAKKQKHYGAGKEINRRQASIKAKPALGMLTMYRSRVYNLYPGMALVCPKKPSFLSSP